MGKCVKCLITEGKYNVKLNDEGVCNYCEAFDAKKEELLNPEKNEPSFLSRMEKVKGKYEYDALVGISGGKDSSYIVHQLANKYKLKVLTVTYDIGFITDFSKNTIDTIVNKLGVDHFYYKPNWDIHKKLYKAAIENFGDPCIGCAFVGFFTMLKICDEKKIPFFIHGRTPYQMYKNYYEGSKDLYFDWMKLNASEHSFAELAKSYRPANDYMRQFITSIANTPEDAKEFLDEFFIDTDKLTDKFTPEFLAYFLFETYDKDKMEKKLEEEFGWVPHPGESKLGHNDCILNAGAGYMFKELHGVSVLEREVGAMIRFGCCDKETSQKWMDASQVSDKVLDESINKICDICDCTREEFKQTINKLKEKNANMFGSR